MFTISLLQRPIFGIGKDVLLKWKFKPPTHAVIERWNSPLKYPERDFDQIILRHSFHYVNPIVMKTFEAFILVDDHNPPHRSIVQHIVQIRKYFQNKVLIDGFDFAEFILFY